MVDVFFVISGYLLVKKADRWTASTSVYRANIQQTVRRFKSLLPFFLPAIVTGTVINSVCQSLDAYAVLQNVVFSLGELFCVQMVGLPGTWPTGVAWYLSVLMVGSFMLFPVIVRHRDALLLYAAPLVAIFFYGYLFTNTASIASPGTWLGFAFKGMIRGVAALCLGCFARELSDRISLASSRCVYGVLEVLCYVAIFSYAVLVQQPNPFEFYIPFLACLAVAVSFSTKSALCRFFDCRICNQLGVFSLSIFLNHYFIAQNMRSLSAFDSGKELITCYLAIVFALSLANHFLGNALIRLHGNLASRQKSDFLEPRH